MENTPPPKDAASRKDAILDAAEQIFIERGFAETSISRISRAARVTKSLIHHHFGSKGNLWMEVKRRRLQAYLDVQRTHLATAGTDIDTLKSSIISFFALLRQSPELVRLLSWHLLETDHAAFSEDEEREVLALGIERLAEAQERGLVRKDIDPKHVLFSFLSMVIQWFEAREHYLKWVGQDPENPREDDAYLDAMIHILFEGILPREGGASLQSK
jgi:TetR/AcrR family transcriptional regulator